MKATPKENRTRAERGNNGETPCDSTPKRAARAARAAEADAAGFETPDSRRLCEEISKATGGVCFLGFSRGKDSISAWLYLRRFFARIIPFHCASMPHLRWVDESLDYYERFFGTPILRFMDGSCTGAVSRLVWQPPGSEDEVDSLELWTFDKHDIIACLQNEMELPQAWCAFGINQTDSIDRRIYVGKNHGRNPQRMTFYPCYDWKKSQIVGNIQEAGVRLPADYEMAARTMAAVPSYRHLLRMEAMHPDDFRRLQLLYPMIRAELARQHFRETKWAASQAARESAADATATPADLAAATPTGAASPCTAPARAVGDSRRSPSTGGR